MYIGCRYYEMCSYFFVHISQLRFRGGVVQWVARLTRDQWIPVSREFEPHQRPRCFLEQETLLSLLSTGWFHERIRA